MVLSLGSGLSFCNGDLLPNFNKIVEYELLIMEFDNSKTWFSIVPTNLRGCLNMLGQGANGVKVERRKSEDD